MYDGTKKVIGPWTIAVQDIASESSNWRDHYRPIKADGALGQTLLRALFHKDNSVSEAALNAVGCLPTMDELDNEPTPEELCSAVDALAAG